MGKYLALWKIDATRLPVGRKERAAGWKVLLNFVKEDIKDGKLLDWGSFLGELKGFGIMEGDIVEVNVRIQRYSPFVHFKLSAISSLEQTEQLIEEMTK